MSISFNRLIPVIKLRSHHSIDTINIQCFQTTNLILARIDNNNFKISTRNCLFGLKLCGQSHQALSSCVELPYNIVIIVKAT